MINLGEWIAIQEDRGLVKDQKFRGSNKRQELWRAMIKYILKEEEEILRTSYADDAILFKRRLKNKILYADFKDRLAFCIKNK